MKKALMGIFVFASIVFFLLGLFTVHGKDLRQNELDNAFYGAMKNAMEMLLVQEGAPETETEWKEMFVHSIAVQINSASDLEVNILEADMEKGLLSAEAVLYFKNPNGSRTAVEVSDTIFLEKYVETKAELRVPKSGTK